MDMRRLVRFVAIEIKAIRPWIGGLLAYEVTRGIVANRAGGPAYKVSAPSAFERGCAVAPPNERKSAARWGPADGTRIFAEPLTQLSALNGATAAPFRGPCHAGL